METYFLGQARAHAKNSAEWQRYAAELEEQLRIANASVKAAMALKDVAIAELSKVEPKHYLTVQTNRQAILNAAFNDALAGRTAA